MININIKCKCDDLTISQIMAIVYNYTKLEINNIDINGNTYVIISNATDSGIEYLITKK